MPEDGEIDYSRLTDAQLEEASQRIDARRYPVNARRLQAETERRRAATTSSAAVAAEGTSPEILRLEFNADPKAYFRIWIVNLALSIVTLGIYSAWAKVRKHRYFYGSTTLAGSAFAYYGEPLVILRGRVIATLLALLYFGAARWSIKALLATVGLIAVATPFLVVKSRQFTLRMTSWRGIRFGFRADYRKAYAVLLGWTLAGAATLGLLMPRALRERYRFIVEHGRYGSTAFRCSPSIGRFYRTMLGAVGMVFLGMLFFMLIVVPVVVAARELRASPVVVRVLTQVAALIGYAVMFALIQGYTQARNLNEVFGTTTLGPHRVRSSLRARSLVALYLTNALAIVFTLGMLTPWAQLRLARYRLSAVALEVRGSLDELTAGAVEPAPAAAGEELSSILDLDIGF
jgi:uncharacterized membrane protein YjgN (DUF898 family)